MTSMLFLMPDSLLFTLPFGGNILPSEFALSVSAPLCLIIEDIRIRLTESVIDEVDSECAGVFLFGFEILFIDSLRFDVERVVIMFSCFESFFFRFCYSSRRYPTILDNSLISG
jgi:hypothetical protein